MKQSAFVPGGEIFSFAYLYSFPGDEVTLGKITEGTVGTTQIDKVTVVQRCSDFIKDVKGKGVKTPRSRHGCDMGEQRKQLT